MRLRIPRIRALDLRDPYLLSPDRHFIEPGDWFAQRKQFGAYGESGPVVVLTMPADEIEWDWPAVPACAGRRNVYDFNAAHAILYAGDALRILSTMDAFGLTIRGGEVVHDN